MKSRFFKYNILLLSRISYSFWRPQDKNNHYFYDRCLSFNHLAISKDVEFRLQRFLTMNTASFDINVCLYFVLFGSTRVYIKIYAQFSRLHASPARVNPGLEKGAPGWRGVKGLTRLSCKRYFFDPGWQVSPG